MIRINLAPPSTKKARPSLSGASGINLGLVFGVLFVALIALLGGYWWKVSSEIARLNSEIAQAEAEKTRLATVIAEGQRYKREKEELESRVNAIERDRPRPGATDVPDGRHGRRASRPISGSLGSRRKGQQLRFAGTTYSSLALSDFMSNLKASGKFKDVDLVESRQDLTKSPRTITFEVSCRFEI